MCRSTFLVSKFVFFLSFLGKILDPAFKKLQVHGGTTHEDIIKTVKTAEVEANRNVVLYGRHMYTVLFFDEANTTEAIGIIKEIMCDKSIAGKSLKLCENLKIIAACNPYRK